MMKFRTLTLFEMQLAQRLKELDRFSIRTESVETGQLTRRTAIGDARRFTECRACESGQSQN